MSKRNYDGYLITLEGPEGSGKTTVWKETSTWLTAKHGIHPLCPREPGGHPLSEKIGDLLRDISNTGMSDSTEMFMFQACRAELTDKVLIPALKEGRLIFLDRFADSSVVYQGVARGLGVDMINYMNKISTKGLKPDLTILMDLPIDLGLERKSRQGVMERIDSELIAFHRLVREAYLKLYETNEDGRWEIVDASKNLGEVVESVQNIVETRLTRSGFIERPNISTERRG